MHEEDRDNEHKSSRFHAEAGTLYGLKHPNIVRLYDAGETEDDLFFTVMELLQGETLTQRLSRGRLHPLRALQYAHDVACGLDAAHEIGVVHRDIKPDNLFITLDDTVKILDFTAAKFFHAALRTTEPSARVGTIAFMSPEALEGKTSDARLDQYALALCLYCMLRGVHPYQRHFDNQYLLMRAHSFEDPEPLSKCAAMPAWIDDLLAPALAKEVSKRYETMALFLRAIRQGMKRMAREMRDGSLAFDVPLGEPAIDLDELLGERVSQQVYVAPEETVRQVTAPVMPSERVSVAPDALPDALPAEPSDSTATAPLPSASQRAAAMATAPRTALRSTTAPVHTTAPAPTTAATMRVPRPGRSRMWLMPLALVLALPAVGGLLWRERAQPHGPQLSAQAAQPPASVTVEPAEGPTPVRAPEEAPAKATASASQPVLTPPAPAPAKAPAKPKGHAAPPLTVTAEPTAPAAPPPVPTAAPPPVATVAPHRVFESDD
jgi:hypothetical protein